jgi:hypothetical protein
MTVNKFYDADPLLGIPTATDISADYLNSLGLPPTITAPVRTVTASTTIQADTDYIILIDATDGDIVLSLPSVLTLFSGRKFIFKKIDATEHSVTLTPSGSETIDLAATMILENRNELIHLLATESDYQTASMKASAFIRYAVTMAADGTIPFLSTLMACNADPNGSDRNLDPASGFLPGSILILTNSGEETIIFDSSGIARAVKSGRTAVFIFGMLNTGTWSFIAGNN